MVKKIIFILIPIVLTLSHLSQKFHLWQKSRQEITKMEQKIGLLQEEKRELEKQKKYYESEEFIKKQARENLGLIKPNEKVLVLPTLEEKDSKGKTIKQNSQPAYKQWYNLFFN